MKHAAVNKGQALYLRPSRERRQCPTGMHPLAPRLPRRPGAVGNFGCDCKAVYSAHPELAAACDLCQQVKEEGDFGEWGATAYVHCDASGPYTDACPAGTLFCTAEHTPGVHQGRCMPPATCL